MNNKIIIAIGALILIGVGIFMFSQKEPVENTSTSTATSTSEVTSLPEESGISKEEVAAHNTRETCWVTINGGVYDLTMWISKHPGGQQAILSLCGKDGTAAFMGQHGGNGVAISTLASFKIGDLAK